MFSMYGDKLLQCLSMRSIPLHCGCRLRTFIVIVFKRAFAMLPLVSYTSFLDNSHRLAKRAGGSVYLCANP